MKITPLQSNINITEGKRAGVPDTVRNDNNSSFAAADDTVIISQQARELANEKRVVDANTAKYDNRNKNPEPEGNLLTMAKRYLDYYINNNKDLAIKVRDKETKKVIKEIPLKEEQKLRADIEKMADKMSNSGEPVHQIPDKK